jgi:hypothetical protein
MSSVGGFLAAVNVRFFFSFFFFFFFFFFFSFSSFRDRAA